MRADHDVRRIDRADRGRAAAALASGFAEDPVHCWLAGVADCERRLARYWRATLGAILSSPHGIAYAAGDLESVAVWREVDGWKVTAGELVRIAPAYLAAVRARAVAGLSLLSALERAHPDEPHLYLEYLATRRDRQGRGLGAAVLQPVLDRADEEGLGCYLESSNPRNRPFYARLGFRELGEVRGRRGGPPLVPMWRAPR